MFILHLTSSLLGANETAMMSDISIRVRLKTPAEGGRNGPILGPRFGCVLFVEGEAFDCRLLIDGRDLELGNTYEVPLKFLNASLVMDKLSIGTSITLWEGKEIAAGTVVRVGS